MVSNLDQDKDEALNREPLGSETVLLVEDEPLVRRMTATMLKGRGYVVLEATNGEEALRLAREYFRQGIQLLITDVVMPRMGGIELSDKFSDLYPNARTLLMSGYTDAVVTDRALLSEGAGFLQKPFTAAALATKVREVMEGPVSHRR